MKAIIVPGVTDLNKGDQALVWESHRLAKDTNLFSEIFILNNGDTEEEIDALCGQSAERGFKFIDNILKHPRRGKHNDEEHVKQSTIETLRLIKNAIFDFLSTYFLICFAKSNFFVKLFYSKATFKTIARFKESDMIFIKGGGFIHAYGEKTAPYLMWYFLFYPRLAKKFNKKVIFLPNSYGPFEGLTVKRQVKRVLSKLDLIYAREHVSAGKLSDLLNIKIPVEMDLGFFLESGSDIKAEAILKKYNLSKTDKIVGITIRPWRFPGKSNPEVLFKNYIDSVTKLTDHIIKLGYKVAFCNQAIGPNSHEDDRNAIKQVLSNFKNTNVTWIDENLHCDTLKAVYSNFYLFIGTRFHSIIFSLTSLVPSIAIGYGGNKARGIMGDFDLNEYVLQIDEVSADRLISRFDSAVSEYDKIQDKLNHSMHKIEDSRDRIINSIKSLV